MYTRRSTTVKYVMVLITILFIYTEWVVFLTMPWFWQDMECQNNAGSCVKILFVADPQIQGEDAVDPPLSWLFNWDSDRYLKTTFAMAIEKFKADVIVFMGDLMDEGSISTLPQFYRYLKRLADIFEVAYDVTFVWIPGDNDIGGENEPVKGEKLEEFEKAFQQPAVVDYQTEYQNISFYKVNGITNSIPPIPTGDRQNNFKVIVSHYPTTVRLSFGQQVNKLNPHIFFCAHDHESKYVKQDINLTNRKIYNYGYKDPPLIINFDNKSIYEIYVPTCSYRMGTTKIGFGAAVLENNNQEMRYTVFWSPQRFQYLFIYLGVLAAITIYLLIFCTAKFFYRHPKILTNSPDRQPLLG